MDTTSRNFLSIYLSLVWLVQGCDSIGPFSEPRALPTQANLAGDWSRERIKSQSIERPSLTSEPGQPKAVRLKSEKSSYLRLNRDGTFEGRDFPHMFSLDHGFLPNGTIAGTGRWEIVNQKGKFYLRLVWLTTNGETNWISMKGELKVWQEPFEVMFFNGDPDQSSSRVRFWKDPSAQTNR
jgi:hypothetical protein